MTASVRADVLLEVSNLRTEIAVEGGTVQAVNGVSFTIRRGESVGLVGESGSGKTTTALSCLRLTPSNGRIVEGKVSFDGVDLLSLPEARMREYRGHRIAMVMQDPLMALNPVLRIGDQVGEPVRWHLRRTPEQIRERVIEVLNAVRIPRPADRVRQYPHQFSGGMRQRIVAAMGLSTSPELIIADEPTTALDVTIQAQFLALIRDLKAEASMAVLWITHDLGVVSQICDRVNVMYAGRIVESGPVRRILRQPQHPYTSALMESVPRLGQRRQRLHQIDGQPPDLAALPPGCPYYSRCPLRMEVCRDTYPPATPTGPDGFVHCWART